MWLRLSCVGAGKEAEAVTESVIPKVEIVNACLECKSPAFEIFLQVSVGNGADLQLQPRTSSLTGQIPRMTLGTGSP